MSATLEQRMASALCKIMRGMWHDGWGESEVRDCMMHHELIGFATADSTIAQMSWASDAEIVEGDRFEALHSDLLNLELAYDQA